MFRALLLEKDDDGDVRHRVTELSDDDLMTGDTTVDVEYSTVNYKDGLAITNRSPVVRRWPMIPGVDLAGTVAASDHAGVAAGDRVVLNGWDVGEVHYGGYAQRARVDGSWLTRLPEAISSREAMAIGTAGYTAMLCVMALEEHDVTPDSGPVVVTGAAGGVGSTAVAVLAGLGYQVIASTGRIEEKDYLTGLGAAEVIDRSELSEPGRPLGSTRWAGGVDSVGSHTLVNILARTQQRGAVAACGLAQGMDLPGSVAPFILRGVTLVGVDSVHETAARREAAWDRLAADLDRDKLAAMTDEVGLEEVPGVAERILAGQVRGRVVVDVNR